MLLALNFGFESYKLLTLSSGTCTFILLNIYSIFFYIDPYTPYDFIPVIKDII